jgi:hypothetical protein
MARVPVVPRRMRLPKSVIRPTMPYFFASSLRTRLVASASRMTASAGTWSPVGRPRRSHGPTVIDELRRMRLTLPESEPVQIASASPSRTTQTAVGTPRPSLRKVVTSAYWLSPNASRVDVTGQLYRGRRGRAATVIAMEVQPGDAWRVEHVDEAYAPTYLTVLGLR